MSYGMPAPKLDGRLLIRVIAAAKHLSVFPLSPAVIDAVAPQSPEVPGFMDCLQTVR
jgi:uncharacterized protein YdhG (YjbR/CyaY superfamily)